MILSGVAAAMAALVAWGGGILYWHVRLRSAIRASERTSAPGGSVSEDEENLKALECLTDAGCRSLPSFIRALDPDKPLQFLQESTQFIGGFPGWPDVEAIASLDSVPERRAKGDRIREWWKGHGGDVRQAWRFWSRRCDDR